MLIKYNVRMWIGFIWPRIEFSGRLCEDGNELLNSMKYG
jgi:hypothetical protein